MLRSLFIRTHVKNRRVRQQPLSSSIGSFSARQSYLADDSGLSNDDVGSSIRNNAIHTSVGSVTRSNMTTQCRPRTSSPLWIGLPKTTIPSSIYVHNSNPQPNQFQSVRYMSSYNYNARNNSRAFVSKYNNSINVSAEDILEYCAKHNGNALIDGARTTNSHVVLRECPFCTKPTRNEPSNLYKLHIQIGGGAFFLPPLRDGGILVRPQSSLWWL